MQEPTLLGVVVCHALALDPRQCRRPALRMQQWCMAGWYADTFQCASGGDSRKPASQLNQQDLGYVRFYHQIKWLNILHVLAKQQSQGQV